MSSESNFSFTTKVDGDLYTVRADDIDTFEVHLQHAAAVISSITALQNAARGLAPATPVGAAVVTQTFGAKPLPSQASEQPIVQPSYGAPIAAPTCAHGPRKHKSGTAKSGKPYSAWFCQSQGPDKCDPEWGPAR
jgi:hypothetical protein